MKKVFTLLAALAVFTSVFAINFVEAPRKKASEIFLPIGANGATVSVLNLSQMSVQEFETVSGNHLKLGDKIGFKLAQRELRKNIAADGTINSKKVNKYLTQMADGTTGFHVGGFALGFLLGLVGVLIAYLIKDEKKKNRVKWSWIGLASFLVIYLVLVL